VYRLGISPTRSGARQFVSHRHITVNGEVLNIPSYQVKEGDVIGVREKSKSIPGITASIASNNKSFDWMEWNPSEMSGKFIKVPERVQIPENIKEQLIVELYSK
jgi:small subunit ribosomal protein S4